jgi:hypothetical protein
MTVVKVLLALLLFGAIGAILKYGSTILELV